MTTRPARNHFGTVRLRHAVRRMRSSSVTCDGSADVAVFVRSRKNWRRSNCSRDKGNQRASYVLINESVERE